MSPDEFDQFEFETLARINSTPEMQSLLYYLNLLPEQLESRKAGWRKMLNIAHHMHLYACRYSLESKGE